MAHETMEHLTWRLATALRHDDGAELLSLPPKGREKAVKSLRFARADVLNALLLEGEARRLAERVSCSAFALRLALCLAGNRVEPPPAA